MLTYDKIQNLGQVLNGTFGVASTESGKNAYNSFNGRACTGKIIEGDQLKVAYITIVNMPVHRDPDFERRLADESISIIGKFVDKTKKEYKDLAKESIRLKEESSVDSIELIALNQYSPVKRAYYRRNTLYSIS
jgi:hypothetical protein